MDTFINKQNGDGWPQSCTSIFALLLKIPIYKIEILRDLKYY